MKKILFMIINMNIGGMEKALLNMINKMDKKQYEITILMLEEYGGFIKDIPSHVKKEYMSGYKNIKRVLNQPPRYIIYELIKDKSYIKAFNIFFLTLITKILGDRTLFFKYIFKSYSKDSKIYDLAIAYAGPTDYITYYVLDKINARKKVQWIHFDVSKVGFNKQFAKNKYKKFDKIFLVSNEAKSKLISEVPSLKEKVDIFYNIISNEEIKKSLLKADGFNDNFKGIRILTVGRLSFEKGQDMSIKAAKMLFENGIDFRWYCIGEGNQRKNYEKLIKEYDLNKRFILLGSNNNPYKYMEECDIYVQSSRHEGYCITLAEARILNKPIVTTNFTGAREQIIHEKTGLICDCNESSIYTQVRRLIECNNLRYEFKKNLKYANGIEQNHLYKLDNIIN